MHKAKTCCIQWRRRNQSQRRRRNQTVLRTRNNPEPKTKRRKFVSPKRAETKSQQNEASSNSGIKNHTNPKNQPKESDWPWFQTLWWPDWCQTNYWTVCFVTNSSRSPTWKASWKVTRHSESSYAYLKTWTPEASSPMNARSSVMEVAPTAAAVAMIKMHLSG